MKVKEPALIKKPPLFAGILHRDPEADHFMWDAYFLCTIDS
jgi:hypothetical protein